MKPGLLFAAIAVSVLAYAPAHAQDPVAIKLNHVVTTQAPKGSVGLAYWDNDFKDMTGKGPLLHPNDFNGMKMRIQSSRVLDA